MKIVKEAIRLIDSLHMVVYTATKHPSSAHTAPDAATHVRIDSVWDPRVNAGGGAWVATRSSWWRTPEGVGLLRDEISARLLEHAK